jgi:transposase-like protein
MGQRRNFSKEFKLEAVMDSPLGFRTGGIS